MLGSTSGEKYWVCYFVHLNRNEHVADLHTAAREAFLLWKDTGKNKQGPVFELKKRTNNAMKML